MNHRSTPVHTTSTNLRLTNLGTLYLRGSFFARQAVARSDRWRPTAAGLRALDALKAERGER